MTNKCYYLLAGSEAGSRTGAIEAELSRVFDSRPRLILIVGGTGEKEDAAAVTGNYCPVLTLTNYSRVAIACPDCSATHRGVWKVLS